MYSPITKNHHRLPFEHFSMHINIIILKRIYIYIDKIV